MNTLSQPSQPLRPSACGQLILLALLLLLVHQQSATGHEDRQAATPSSPGIKLNRGPDQTPNAPWTTTHLPPLPNGVVDLKFGDFFVKPVSAGGLQLTSKVQALHGQRVRILGFMVDQEEAPPGRLLLSPLRTQIHEHDNALADDLPPSTVFVYVPTSPNNPIPYTPGLMLLTGVLQVGNQTEPDGRISVVRLILDPPEKAGHGGAAFPFRSVGNPKGGEALMRSPASKPAQRR